MTSPRVPQAIVFDLDGTLVDTVGTRVEAWMAVFPRFGIVPDPAFLAPLMGSDGKYLARMTAEHYGVALEPGEDAEIDRQAGAEFRVLNADPRALPAARELLETLTDRGLPWAVATSSLPDDAHASVASLGLRSMPLICDGADVEHAKPAPDLLLKAAHLLAVEPSETWYVGDSRWDMVASKAAGMRAIAVLTGATPEEALGEAGADVIYPTLAELKADLPIG
ncbi:MAG: HAD family phosphatase [Chloroflexota bacterium]|jgi:HAD superfamily hydrolase (TIGR01509 family)